MGRPARGAERDPRAWTPAEGNLIREVGERVKAATERARAEVALRESEERLAAIFSAASVGLSEVDASGRYLRVNTEMCRILGRSADEVLSVGVADVTDPAYIPQSLATIAQRSRPGTVPPSTSSIVVPTARPSGRAAASDVSTMGRAGSRTCWSSRRISAIAGRRSNGWPKASAAYSFSTRRSNFRSRSARPSAIYWPRSSKEPTSW